MMVIKPNNLVCIVYQQDLFSERLVSSSRGYEEQNKQDDLNNFEWIKIE